jgi:hypothetical protein
VVKETPLFPRECLSASEKHLCPQAIQKKAINPPLPTLIHRITVFWIPLYSPICSLFLLFSTNKFSTIKIVLTSAVKCLSVLPFSEQAQEP